MFLLKRKKKGQKPSKPEIKSNKEESSTLAQNTRDSLMISATVYTNYHSQRYKLLFNETILSLFRDEEISIQLEESPKWTFVFKFQQSTSNQRTYNENITSNTITYTLINWYAEDGTEVSNPIYIGSDDKEVQLLIKFRSAANLTQNTRITTISIWRKV